MLYLCCTWHFFRHFFKWKKPKISLRLLYGRGDSNSHTSRHQILSLTCLPIPPRPHFNILTLYISLCPKSSVHLPKQHQSHSFSIDYIICHFLWYHLISIDFNICCTYVVPRETNKFVSLGKLLGKLNIQNWMLYLCCTWFGFRTQN